MATKMMLARTLVLLGICSFGPIEILAAGSSVVVQQAEILTSPRSTTSPTNLLFGYVTSLGGFDTEFEISNTSKDTLGSPAQSGSCTMNYYGSGQVAAQTTSTIAAGGQLVFRLSQGGGGLAPVTGFQGYGFASCNFASARGTSKTIDPSNTNGFATSQDAQIVTLPRSASTNLSTNLLYPFATNATGFDTGLTIANTSTDPFGTAASSGSCTMNFYGSNAPAAFVTPTIASGTVYSALLSVVAPGFAGYLIASCNFQYAYGFAFISTIPAATGYLSVIAETLPVTRTAAATVPLLFPYVSNQNGRNDTIIISNTTSDPLGTTKQSGTCSLNFYGSGAPSPANVTTPNVPSGTVYTASLSKIAAGFAGYLTASCGFGQPRGLAFTGGAPGGDMDIESAQVLSLPRSLTPAPLLFTIPNNVQGSDTAITLTNSTLDNYGTTPSSGTCSLFYSGTVNGGGTSPATQISTAIAPGSALSFTVSAGNSAQGIVGTPGFRGYIIASCGFPLALGVAVVTTPASSLLTTITNVTSTKPNGTYGVTASIPIQVTFSAPVTVTGTPQLSLNSGGTATYSSGSGTTTLTFNYTAGPSDSSTHLDYSSAAALTLNGGTINDATSTPATLTLPSPGSAGSLGANTNFAITAAPPFFSGEAALANSVYYLQFANGNLFGYFGFQGSSVLYHFDMGYEGYVPGSGADIYFYDFATTHWLYSSSTLFPYLYDFTLKSWIYYFPDTTKAGHYTTNPRYFSNLTTGQVFTM